VAGSARRNAPRRKLNTPRLRWLIAAGALLIAFLYYRPLHSYVQTRQTLAQRTAEVHSLRSQGRDLRRRLVAAASDEAVIRDARRLGLVRPGEKLYIVTGIDAWRRAHRGRAGRP
jgi:cell division protein FtsB